MNFSVEPINMKKQKRKNEWSSYDSLKIS